MQLSIFLFSCGLCFYLYFLIPPRFPFLHLTAIVDKPSPIYPHRNIHSPANSVCAVDPPFNYYCKHLPPRQFWNKRTKIPFIYFLSKFAKKTKMMDPLPFFPILLPSIHFLFYNQAKQNYIFYFCSFLWLFSTHFLWKRTKGKGLNS